MNYLYYAMELAVENVQQGGSPFGAVLVLEGEVISTGVNLHHRCYDVTTHAEIEAVRKAQHKLQTDDLSACTMYASGMPCPMCLAAMYFVGIRNVYYAQTLEEAETVGLGTSKQIYSDLAKESAQWHIHMVHVPTSHPEDPMKLFQQMKGE
ncbi:nucleoside deaminase [Pontibacillus litoralis]|uniref:Guanine deaminase n=1 Tax=Pontibacillus litoralis JSM 072002 TaxID=1385512 RepID=A0A0A5G812_9BACI|nr:nucleoside deaminase [Pontibacillus litoralis]KGX88174.1 guanine deaminase [Pontibacillus litoralis JSM 072002]